MNEYSELIEESSKLHTVYDIVDKWELLGIQSHTLPNAVGMWREELEYFTYLLLDCQSDDDWVEIGAFCGGTACLMGLVKSMSPHTGSGQIISVDINFNNMFDVNVSRLPPAAQSFIQKFEIDSSEFSKIYCDQTPLTSDGHKFPQISFSLIDGFHSYEQVIKDFEQVEPFLSDGAIVTFHDVSPYIFDKNHREQCHQSAWTMEDGVEDFRLDEAICDILMDHQDFELLQRPSEFDAEHFQETGLTEWVRGKTSPFNSLVAIRRKNGKAI